MFQLVGIVPRKRVTISANVTFVVCTIIFYLYKVVIMFAEIMLVGSGHHLTYGGFTQLCMAIRSV